MYSVFGEAPGSKEYYVTLASGIKLVTEQSHLIKIAVKGKEMAHDDLRLARAAFFPQINTAYSQNYLAYEPAAKFGPQIVPTSEKDYNEFGFNLYQTLYDFGANYSNYQASRSLLEGSEFDIRRTKNQAVLEFITAYFDVLESRHYVNTAKKEVNSLNAYFREASALRAQGAVTNAELLAAKVALAQAHQHLSAAKNFESVAYARLATVLSLPRGTRVSVETVTFSAPGSPKLLDALDTAQKRRPEIRVYEETIRASAYKEAAQKAGYLPTVFSNGGYSYLDNKYMARDDNWFVKFGVKMNVFNGGYTYAQVSRERHRQEQLIEQKKRLQDEIFIEVKLSHARLANVLEQAGVVRQALAVAKENLRVQRAQYAQGSITNAEMMRAITFFTQAQFNYWSTAYELRRAHARLLYSMGMELDQFYLGPAQQS